MGKQDGSGKSLERKDWVPLISLLLILAALPFSDLNYWTIETATTLFFYAVSVQMWTEFGSHSPIGGRDEQFLMFILTAVGGVIIGAALREGAVILTGDILAVQSLALGILFSRWYINARDASKLSPATVLRYKDPLDQRVILAPCLFSFLFPAFQYQTQMYLFDFETGRGFFGLILASILFGLLVHMYKTGELRQLYQEIQNN